MHQLELQALILRCEAFDAQANLPLGTADRIPCNQALGAGGAVNDVPKEGPAQRVDGAEEGRRELKGTHSEGEKGVEHRVEQHNLPAGGEEEGTPP
jgi:hypothetical protein